MDAVRLEVVHDALQVGVPVVGAQRAGVGFAQEPQRWWQQMAGGHGRALGQQRQDHRAVVAGGQQFVADRVVLAVDAAPALRVLGLQQVGGDQHQHHRL